MWKSNETDRPIRVLIVGPDLPIVGGQTVQARAIIENFRGDDEVHVDFQPINPTFLPRLQGRKYIRTLVTTFKFITDLLTKIPRYDLIHIFSASYFSFLLSPTPALFVSKLFGKKTILNYRSGEADDHLTRWKTAVPTIRAFDRVVVPSGYLVDVFQRYELNAQAIFNVVDTGRFKFRKRSSLAPVFLSNRNFEPLYNVEATIRAFAVIQSTFPDASLIVAGDGSERANLMDLVSHLDLRKVLFLGSVPPSEMPSVYDRADIYLNSPNLDNMPNSIIEAFASGLAVVSTNAGGIPFIVDHERNGLLVPVGDYEALTREAIRLLTSQELADRLVTQALADCEKYSWKDVRGQWVNLYRDLAERSSIIPETASDRRVAASAEN